MTENCPCDEPKVLRLDILPGLDALPRQLQSFPEVRDALIRAVATKPVLAQWRPGGTRDLGLMWLEMWAYVADVLGFYDERIANETYLRTAQRSPSLRRIVDLLGYVASPGVAGEATLAALADGRRRTVLAPGTAFRSDAFGDNAPQVFELRSKTPIHPFKNEWTIGAQRTGRLPQPTPSEAPGQVGEGAPEGRYWVFDTAGFNLTKDRFALFEFRDKRRQVVQPRRVTKVVATSQFIGKDGQPYIEVEVDPPVPIPSASRRASRVRVLTPTITAGVAKRPSGSVRISESAVALDAIYRQLREHQLVIFANEAEKVYAVRRTEKLSEVNNILGEDNREEDRNAQVLTNVITRVSFTDKIPGYKSKFRAQFTFHFGLVEAGNVTTVAEADVDTTQLTSSDGVPISGNVEVPPDTDDGTIEQDCLLVDADQKGALVTAQIRFDGHGRANFRVTDQGTLRGALKAPITVYGNLVETTRGETVVNEVLGNGDARSKNQRFVLKKKPLTYVRSRTDRTNIQSTLRVRVDNVLWKEVKSFYGRGPEEQVFIVRHDDDQNASVIFGDGVRGARLPTGPGNVMASYRFGSGQDAPPAQGIQQLARPVPGLRGVRAPIKARPGLAADSPANLRLNAPRAAQTIRNAVSAVDFEVLALLSQGVLQAKAEYLWLEDEQRAGVFVTYIGDIAEADLKGDLEHLAEENLPIRVNRAEPRPSSLRIDINFDSRYNGKAVERNCELALTDPETGLLSPRRAEIGGRLWVSQIYEVVQSIEGVIGIQNIVLKTKRMSRESMQEALNEAVALSHMEIVRAKILLGKPHTYHLARTDVLCTAPATYFDFEDGDKVNVRSVTRTKILQDTPRRQEEV